jgi:tetratricopeptide (TPR) repeat protein
MKKELKRHIKQDEFVTGLQRLVGWTRAHQRELKVGVLVLAVTAALVIGVDVYRDRRQAAAQAAFAAAIEVYHAPTQAELQGQPPAGTVHATDAERSAKAKAAFDTVAEKYPSMEAGRRARYYAALCRMELGELAEADKALAELAQRQGDDDLVPALARMALADAHRRAGRLDKAADAYRQMADDASFALPRDYVLMRLGALLEDAHRPEEAMASYRRLAEEFPASPYAGEARRRADYLGPARS